MKRWRRNKRTETKLPFVEINEEITSELWASNLLGSLLG